MSNTSIAELDEKKIDAIFAKIDQSNLPGAAVAVAIDGVPVYRKGFGLANMELPVTLSSSMRMRIGSTTKHFAALAFMLQCEDGLASPDDEIGKFIPELHEASRHVTMRHLMGHTSGIRDIISITMMFHGTGRPITDKELLAYYSTIDDVDFAPGTHWSYNNGGYMLLSIAIERIAGEPLADVLRKRIFAPLGMHDTMLRPWDSDFVPNSATLHMVDATGRYTRDYMGMEISGAGGMVSTMDDMLIWLKHMDAPTIGSAETWKAMKAPRDLTHGASTGYGFGLITSAYRGVETLSHSGGVMGGNSQMIKVPSAKLDISIAVNRSDLVGAMLANEIIDACVEGLDPLPETPKADEAKTEEASAKAAEAKVSDRYFTSQRTGRVLGLSSQNKMQLLSVDGMPGFPVTPDAAGVLRLPPMMSFMKQFATPEGTSLRFSDFGTEEVFTELEHKPDAKLGEHAGTYDAPMIDIQATFMQSEEGAQLRTTGRYGTASYKLEPITDRIWKAINMGPFQVIQFIVTFDEDGRGANITAGRMPNILFRKRN
jgi:CubicO group peptidase (beta-lactamase class C family)